MLYQTKKLMTSKLLFAASAIILTLTSCVSNPSQTTSSFNNPSFEGTYISQNETSNVIKLTCVSDKSCTLESTSTIDGKSYTDKKKYPAASRLTDLAQVKYAYDYAQENRNKPSTSPSDAQSIKQLEPLFDKNPAITNCIDLDPEYPKYMVACKVTPSPWSAPTVLLFGTVLANCGQHFCRFAIMPLFESAMRVRLEFCTYFSSRIPG